MYRSFGAGHDVEARTCVRPSKAGPWRSDAVNQAGEPQAHDLPLDVQMQRLRREIDQLREALDSRGIIGQAMGILMERYGIDADRAFAVLKRYSQHRNRKLRDVARDLVEQRDSADFAHDIGRV
jgi:hypothetical protein